MAPSSFLDLLKMPNSRDIHLWADYVELRCLIDPDGVISKADIQGYVKKNKDTRKGSDDFTTDDPEDLSVELELDLKSATRAEDLFKHMEYRAGAFTEFYPFSLSKDGDTLYRRAKLTNKHKLYVFFLLSANTRHITNKSNRSKFTEAFELASADALKNYLPNSAEVHLFGSNSQNKGQYAINPLLLRLKKLAKDLGDDFIGPEDEFGHNGDDGLDIVGWIPLGDGGKGFLLVLGQCACSYDDWAKKQEEPNPSRWRKIINFSAWPSTVIFIPFCFRRNSDAWHKESKLNAILMDRLRMVRLLGRTLKPFTSFPNTLINKALEDRELIV